MVKLENDDIVSIYFDSFTKALTLVVALAWNSAFTEYFKNNPRLQALGPWLYAFIVTAVVVMIMIALVKVREKMHHWHKQLKKQVAQELADGTEDEGFTEQSIDYTQF